MDKIMKNKLAIALTTSFLLTSCMSNQDGGALLGGATGALLGSTMGKGSGRTAAIMGGALLGAIVGSKVGASMDEQDKRKMRYTTQESLESSRSGKTSSWRNPDSGHYGSVTPYRAYENNKGDYCREYSQTVTIAGKTQEAYGTACRRPDGSWEMVKR